MIKNFTDVSVELNLEGRVKSIQIEKPGLIGDASEELIGQSWWDRVEPEQVDALRQTCAEIEPDGLAFASYDWQDASGWFRPVETVIRRRGLETDLQLDIRAIARPPVPSLMDNLRDRALEATSNAFVISDATLPDMPLVYVNPAFERVTGYTATEVLGKNCRFLQGTDLKQPAAVEIRKAVNAGRAARVVLRNYTKDGRFFWNDLTLSPIFDRTGKLTHFVGVQSEITQQKLLEEQLSHAAFHDGLTDLPNRLCFQDRLRTALQASTASGKPDFAVVLLDLDKFKEVNDTFGHLAGDQLLIEVAHRLRAAVRDGDLVARLGGDEFAILANGVTGAAEALQLSERVLAAFGPPICVEQNDVVAAASAGVLIASSEHRQVDELIRDADTALYRAKRAGGGHSVLFAREMRAEAAERRQLEAELREALASSQFRLLYQPITDLGSGQSQKFEALVRWQHPKRGLLAPGAFLEVLEESDLVVDLDRWVLVEACTQLQTWQEELADDSCLSVSINVSGRGFAQPDLIDLLRDALQRSGVPARCLQLEITEGIIMDKPEAALRKLAELRAMGVHVKIDDFGTGHSSLGRLQRFAVDSLKIDKCFVDHIEHDRTSAEIVRSITKMAHAMGLEVVAEGVETERQAELLRQFGCEYGQGYYFAKPLSPEKAFDMMQVPAEMAF